MKIRFMQACPKDGCDGLIIASTVTWDPRIQKLEDVDFAFRQDSGKWIETTPALEPTVGSCGKCGQEYVLQPKLMIVSTFKIVAPFQFPEVRDK